MRFGVAAFVVAAAAVLPLGSGLVVRSPTSLRLQHSSSTPGAISGGSAPCNGYLACVSLSASFVAPSRSCYIRGPELRKGRGDGTSAVRPLLRAALCMGITCIMQSSTDISSTRRLDEDTVCGKAALVGHTRRAQTLRLRGGKDIPIDQRFFYWVENKGGDAFTRPDLDRAIAHCMHARRREHAYTHQHLHHMACEHGVQDIAIFSRC
jgi:hypothetical protein